MGKRIGKILAASILLFALAGWSIARAEEKPGPTPALTTCHLKVEGMTCGICEKSVKKELTKLEGVKEAKASWKDGTAEVVYDPAQVKTEEFLKAVERAGFKGAIVEKKGGE